jgi:hypothetical protein
MYFLELGSSFYNHISLMLAYKYSMLEAPI